VRSQSASCSSHEHQLQGLQAAFWQPPPEHGNSLVICTAQCCLQLGSCCIKYVDACSATVRHVHTGPPLDTPYGVACMPAAALHLVCSRPRREPQAFGLKVGLRNHYAVIAEPVPRLLQLAASKGLQVLGHGCMLLLLPPWHLGSSALHAACLSLCSIPVDE
jgi:hypothetical protein